MTTNTKLDVLTPHNCQLIIIDHQPQMAFGVQSIDRQVLKNNVVALAKSAKVFNIPTIFTTVETQGFSGYTYPELLSAARQPSTEGVGDTDARLLLLFPTLGDARLADDAAVPLAAALAALTVVEEPGEVAGMLLENQGQWGPAHWWPADGVRINDGRHSCRNPHNAFALPEDRLREIGNALNDEK